MTDRHTQHPHTDDALAHRGQSTLHRLDELDDFEVADGDPDIRGWDVKGSDGKKFGKVKELIVDTAAMKARYMDVEVDKKVANAKDDWHVLVPIGQARLDDKHDDVLLDTIPQDNLAGAPAYSGGPVTREHENRLREYFGGAAVAGASTGKLGEKDDYYGHPLYDDRKFWGARRTGREGSAYLTRSEEELAVGKRTEKAGEVQVSKSVETEHVKKAVPVTREEVTVERRPATPGMKASGHIGSDEITVPVVEEEAVVQKRTVPKEEIVIKKHVVTDDQVVEADLKREKVDVNKRGDADARESHR
jgi:uncharacterized protein (TIGR02271 family)